MENDLGASICMQSSCDALNEVAYYDSESTQRQVRSVSGQVRLERRRSASAL